jgi:hypothetical protein
VQEVLDIIHGPKTGFEKHCLVLGLVPGTPRAVTRDQVMVACKKTPFPSPSPTSTHTTPKLRWRPSRRLLLLPIIASSISPIPPRHPSIPPIPPRLRSYALWVLFFLLRGYSLNVSPSILLNINNSKIPPRHPSIPHLSILLIPPRLGLYSLWVLFLVMRGYPLNVSPPNTSK